MTHDKMEGVAAEMLSENDHSLSYVLKNDLGQRYVEVPVHKATRQFFWREYNAKNGYVKATLDNWLGSSLLCVNEKPIYRRIVVRRKSRDVKIKIVLPQDIAFSKVTADRLEALGKLMDSSFRNIFYSYVKGAVQTGCSENFGVIRFLDVYAISEDDWNEETAKKAWRDYKERMAKIGKKI